ncbi:MAG: hypothetical protein ACK2U9_16510, partial [Anaerolineae bacterium]
MSHCRILRATRAMLLAGLLAAPAGRAQDTAPTPEATEARFRSVAAHLDLGGDFYFYLSLDDLLEQAVSTGREFAASLDDDAATVVADKLAAADVALRESGIYNLASIGVSSKPGAGGLNRIKSFVGIDDFLARGSFWKAFGGAPGEMAIANYIPDDAALVRLINMDPAAGWDWIRGMIGTVAGDEALEQLDGKLAEAREAGGVDPVSVIRSLGNELLFCAFLDDSQPVKLPGPQGQTQIPAPSVLLGLAVKDRTIPDLLQGRLAAQGTLLSTQVVDGVETIQVPNPFPLPVPVQPAMAVQDGILLIASTPDLLQRALAAGRGTGRFVEGATFARVFGPLPSPVNGMAYVDPAMSKLLVSMQLSGLQGQENLPPPLRAAIEKWVGMVSQVEGAAVRVNLPDGILCDSLSTQSGRNQVALVLSVVPAAIVAAVVLPAWTRARTQAQGTACSANLRMIEAAKQMYALEHNLEDGEMPPPEGLTPFFPGGLPVCP